MSLGERLMKVCGLPILQVRDLLKNNKELYNYDYRWAIEDGCINSNFRDLDEVLKDLGYMIVDEDYECGEYNDIKGYLNFYIKEI